MPDKQAALTLDPGNGESNESGFSTVLCVDLQVLHQCIKAAQKVANKEAWSMEEQIDARSAGEAAMSTRLCLALRSSQWLKTQSAELKRQGGNVGDPVEIFTKFTQLCVAVLFLGRNAKSLTLDQDTQCKLKLIPQIWKLHSMAKHFCADKFVEKPLQSYMDEAKQACHTVYDEFGKCLDLFLEWAKPTVRIDKEIPTPDWWQQLKATGIARDLRWRPIC